MSVMLPTGELANLSGGDYTFQQDGLRAHMAHETVTYFKERLPDLLEPSLWPANSPYFNPVDYTIWSAREEKVFKGRRIGSVAELKDILINEWNTLRRHVPQMTSQSHRG